MGQKSKPALIKLRIKRTSKGVSIYAKSKILHNWFKDQANSDTAPSSRDGWHGMFYRTDNYPSNLGLQSVGYPIFESGLNISFLRSDRLHEGVTFEFSGVYSSEYLQDKINDIRRAIVTLYKQYIKKFDVSLTLLTREIIS